MLRKHFSGFFGIEKRSEGVTHINTRWFALLALWFVNMVEEALTVGSIPVLEGILISTRSSFARLKIPPRHYKGEVGHLVHRSPRCGVILEGAGWSYQ